MTRPVDPRLLDVSGDFDGFTVWLDDRRLVTKPTWAEACAAYRAALALAESASQQLTRTLEKV